MKQKWIGLLLVIIGGLFLLQNFDVIPEVTRYIFRWPNFLFLIAVLLLLSGRPRASMVLVGIGILFILQRYIGAEIVWPLVLILIGAVIVLRQNGKLAFKEKSDQRTGDAFTITSIFAGNNRAFSNTVLLNGQITVIFGGAELDLREAILEENACFDVICLFGGVEVKAPDHWQIDLQVNPIFGGVSDERRHAEHIAPPLVLRGFVMFGGLEIKS